MKHLVLGASVVALSLVAAPAARAQASVGVSAGISIPTGDFGNVAKSGYSVNGLIGFSMPLSPIGFRGEVGYNSWDGKSGTDLDGTTASSLSGTANVVLQVPMMVVAKPYVIGGIGYHHMKTEAGDVSVTDNKMGWNVGGGLKFGLGTLNTMLEARYVTINTDNGSTHYVPVTFGIMF